MTAFDNWYAREVEAKLPVNFPPELAQVAKGEAARVWNGALHEVEIRGVREPWLENLRAEVPR
jgi:hypothetical protein